MTRIVVLLLQAALLAAVACASAHDIRMPSGEERHRGSNALRSLLDQSEAKISSEKKGLMGWARRMLRRHPGGGGGHCRPGSPPCRGGHKTWRKPNAVARASSSGNSGSQNCPTPPANMTLEDVQAIDIRSLVENSPIMPDPQFIGRECEWQGEPKQFDNGDINLCAWNDKMGVIRSSNKQSYGLYSADIKCPDNYLSGFATTFYLTNDWAQGTQDEIDIEFLNRLNTVMQVNIWVGGQSVDFENVWLPFNCAKGYHNYAILWTPQVIAMFVDYELKHYYPNTEGLDGKKFPKSAMAQVSSFWDGSGICDGCWTGHRQSWTWGLEFVANYRKIRKSPPILNALCAQSYL